MVARCQASTPKLAAWMEANVPEGLTVLMEISDEWEAGKAHFLQTKRGIIEPAKARYG